MTCSLSFLFLPDVLSCCHKPSDSGLHVLSVPRCSSRSLCCHDWSFESLFSSYQLESVLSFISDFLVSISHFKQKTAAHTVFSPDQTILFKLYRWLWENPSRSADTQTSLSDINNHAHWKFTWIAILSILMITFNFSGSCWPCLYAYMH